MAKYTIHDVYAAMLNDCPRCAKSQFVTGVAISLAENPSMDSNTNSPPNRDGSIDRGPWQINNRAHPDVSDACAHDLICATQAAYRISGGFKNWRPWTTFTGGQYRQHVPQAEKGITGGENTQGSGILGTGIGPDVAPGASEAVGSTANAIVGLANVLEHFIESLFTASLWFRVGKVIVGLFLGGLALNMLAKRSGIDVPVKAAAALAA